MTIFDVIRYPISNPPTDDELFLLPENIYNKWLADSFKDFFIANPTQPMVVSILCFLKYQNEVKYFIKIDNLRRIIREME